MENSNRLRNLLEKGSILTLPGVYDCISAKIAEKCGFEALFTSGFGISASSFGEPDYGLVTATEMLDRISKINKSINIPLVADIDTGYGNPLNVTRTVRDAVEIGVEGIIIEDQVWPKRCGHMEGKDVIDANIQVEKIKAAKYSSDNKDLLIIARTDSRSVLGLKEAINRGHMYLEAGADILFIEAPESLDELEEIGKEFNKNYLFANMVEGGRTPQVSSKNLEDMGFNIVVYPVFALFSAVNSLIKSYRFLFENKESKGFFEMVDFKDFEEIIDIQKYKELENKFSC